MYDNSFHCHVCTYRALPAVIVAAIFTMIILCSNYILVKNANDCSCWCLPTLGNVLPLGISVDNVSTKPTIQGVARLCVHLISNSIHLQSTAKYILYVQILETAYGAIVGTNYLLVFVLLITVYSKSLIYIKQMRKQLGKSIGLLKKEMMCLIGIISLESSEQLSVVQLIQKGQTKAKRTVFAFLTVFLINGFCSRLLDVYVQLMFP